VQLFLDDNAAVLAAIVDLTAARKRLYAVAASFTGHAYDQDASTRMAKGETAKQRQLRAQVRSQQMEPIALIARRNLRTTPQFAALQMPKPTVSGEAFIASGKAMADAATIHKDTFIEHGLPSTFLDDFKTALTNLDSSVSDRAQNYNRRLSATKGLDEKEKQGRLVLSVLDSLVEPALAGNQALLHGWQGARLIRRRTGPIAGAAGAPAASTSTGAGASPATPAAAIPTTTTTPTQTTPTTPPVTAA